MLSRIIHNAKNYAGPHDQPFPATCPPMTCKLCLTAIMATAIAAAVGASPDVCAAPSEGLPPPVLRIELDQRDLGRLVAAATPALQKAPDPLAVMHTEGTLATSDSYKRAQASSRDWGVMSALASVFASTGERRYLERYEHYLSAWLATYRISANPIDETGLGHWLLAYRTAGGALSQPVQSRMRMFACDLSSRYQQRQPAQRKTSTNNWQSHRVKLAVMGALACADPGLIEGATALFKDQVRDNLLPTGESIDFAERDAIHYVVYSLEPLLEAALFSGLYDRPLFPHVGPNGQSIIRTLEWLAPYARGELKHEEFVRSTVRFDAQRAAAGIRGFSGPFDPQKTRATYWLATRLDRRWSELSLSLGEPSASQRAPWLAKQISAAVH